MVKLNEAQRAAAVHAFTMALDTGRPTSGELLHALNMALLAYEAARPCEELP